MNAKLVALLGVVLRVGIHGANSETGRKAGFFIGSGKLSIGKIL